MQIRSFITILAIVLGSVIYVAAQAPAAPQKPSVISGDVASVDSAKIVINTKDGPVEGIFTEQTVFKKVSPTNTALSAAVPSAIGDIDPGDKVIATGILSADGKSFPVRTVYLMTKADIAQLHDKETAEWRTRGITGKVTAIDPQTGQFTIAVASLMGSTPTVITPKAGAKFLRYAPDSVSFAEARASTFTDINVGDMVRAVGDKGPEGTTFAAEQVLSGAIQTVAGTVKSVDPEKKEIVISDFQTKKDVAISLATASVLKKIPAIMAERMAGAQYGGGVRPPGGGVRPPGDGGQTPRTDQGGTPAGGQQGTGRPGFGGRGGSVDDMLDRFDNITAADIKVGDMIAVSSTKTSDTTHINAIKLVAGVEPFLRMAQASASGGRRGQGGQSVQSGFTIPGLDGIGFP